ncbi:hypothetical protein [Candidatus Finniella inopinata]|nr:hypothetical protein [Candidatus Finniella inopinata]
MKAKDEYLGNLWQEINEASNRTAADLMTLLAGGWQRKDPKWVISPQTFFSRNIEYSGDLTTEGVQRKLDLLNLLGKDKRAFSQLSSEAGQEEFYQLCGDNTLAAQGFEELMFYQKVNMAIASCMEKPPVDAKADDLLTVICNAMGLNASDLGLLNKQTSNSSSDRRFVIDQIRNQMMRGLVVPNTIFIQRLLKPFAEFAEKEKLQLKEEEAKAKKALKNRKKKEKAKLKKTLAAKESKAASDLASSSSVATQPKKEANDDEEDETSKKDEEDELDREDEEFDLAAALHS